MSKATSDAVKNFSEEEIPTLEGYLPNAELKRIWRWLAESQFIPCPYCKRLHIHGKQPGRRAPHCPGNGSSQYDLEIAGEISPEEYIELCAQATYDDLKNAGYCAERQCKVDAQKTGAELRGHVRRRRKELATIDEMRARKCFSKATTHLRSTQSH